MNRELFFSDMRSALDTLDTTSRGDVAANELRRWLSYVTEYVGAAISLDEDVARASAQGKYFEHRRGLRG